MCLVIDFRSLGLCSSKSVGCRRISWPDSHPGSKQTLTNSVVPEVDKIKSQPTTPSHMCCNDVEAIEIWIVKQMP
jgi:hypothetical protein